ncbi:alpha-L-arabinofuranosidase B [Actinospica robiniae]|uniref:alpha-L-arabinofuranosidase B n=1 Tax=Actinospica robiniae TaxID=304901 RepID=UPI00054E6CEB|nr:alpha-L-arabinofuranosidase B [Actinospica robiniae]
MVVQHARTRIRRLLASLATTLALAAGLLVCTAVTSQAATQEPCDILAAAGTPCVAAHSTTRALFAAYSGALYQVERASDSTYTTVSPLSAGGVANAATQDSFCSGTTCTITRIYDQTSNHNDLTVEGAGGNGSADTASNAAALPVYVGGHKAYGVYIAPGNGYRDNSAKGTATGSTAQGEYMVASGTHVNNGCCFDYGNAETNSDDNGNGHMSAINFGTECWFSPCSGIGPWVQADLENGLFAGGNGSNTANTGNNTPFVTAVVKTNGTSTYAIKGGNSQSGSLTTWYSGALPTASGYAPMHQEGAIVLGTGGDNSKSSDGSFFEGVMTATEPTDATDNAVQANVVAAGYTLPSTPFVSGARISIQATTSCCTADYLQHDSSDDKVVIAAVTSSSSSTDKGDATWLVVPGLANSNCVSLESANVSGDYIRHYNFELYLEPSDGTSQFAQDATFCPQVGNSGTGYSLQSLNFSSKFIRHYNYIGYVAGDGGSNSWDATSQWAADSSWLAATAWS